MKSENFCSKQHAVNFSCFNLLWKLKRDTFQMDKSIVMMLFCVFAIIFIVRVFIKLKKGFSGIIKINRTFLNKCSTFHQYIFDNFRPQSKLRNAKMDQVQSQERMVMVMHILKSFNLKLQQSAKSKWKFKKKSNFHSDFDFGTSEDSYSDTSSSELSSFESESFPSSSSSSEESYYESYEESYGDSSEEICDFFGFFGKK